MVLGEHPTKTYVIYGSGLAGAMTATRLAKSLGRDARIIYLKCDVSEAEPFYGSVTSPSAYEFLRSLGLDEPTLFSKTKTSFSFGTYFRTWLSSLSWVQCHHQPFQVLDGVPFIHHVIRAKADLQKVLVSAQAVLSGRFAHPPKDASVSLSRAEYGYQFSSSEWNKYLEGGLKNLDVQIHTVGNCDVETEGDRIVQITLENGEHFSPDLIIDCSGDARSIMKKVGGDFKTTYSVSYHLTSQTTTKLGSPCMDVRSDDLGWSSQTHLQDHDLVLHVRGCNEDKTEATWGRLEIGSMQDPWIGNCVAIGHAAAVLEPLTPAPMTLLQRDIERLLELVPVTEDHSIECREFNRRFREDVSHSNMFQRALFRHDGMPQSEYWLSASKASQMPELSRKIDQFGHRGLLVKYDLEPFNDEDWIIMHMGMGRYPKTYDRQIERVPTGQSLKHISDMQAAIQTLVPRVPPHDIYVTNMKRYFERQGHV